MPRKAERAKPGVLNYLQIRLDGTLKNAVYAHCRKLDVSMNAWVVEVIKAALRDAKGVPQPPEPRAPLPTAIDEIRAWTTGERLLMPCGKFDTCAGVELEREVHDGMEFCRECEIRVR